MSLEILQLSGDGWRSDLPAVDKLLRKIARKTKSEATRKNYLYTLSLFCRKNNVTAEEVVTWPKTKVEEAIQTFCDNYADTPTNANTYEAQLISFFFTNGYRVGKHSNLELDNYHLPSRYRKTEEYVPTVEEIRDMTTKAGISLRNRCAVLMLYTSGLRNSTLRALRCEDLPDLETCGDKPLKINVHPDMKKIVPAACKGAIPYYTFISSEAVEALRNYKRFITEKYGIDPGQIIFFSDNRRKAARARRRFTPIGKDMLERIVSNAAKSAGLAKWMFVRPHTFRKCYESALRSSGMNIQNMEFLMGHILSGSQDSYYDRSNVEDLREQYAKIRFFPDISREVRDELEEARKEIKLLKQEGAKTASQTDVEELRQMIKNLTNRINNISQA